MKDIEHILHNLPRVHMASEDKKLMRERLLAFTKAHPIGMIVSPYPVSRLSSSWMIVRRHYVSVALTFVFLVGGGISTAAQSAMPGESLYAVKIGFNEPLGGILALTPEAKAKHESELVDRRLSEATSLSAEGKLTEETRTEIENNFDKHVENISESIDDLKSTDSRQAVSVNSDLQSLLQAHMEVFNDVSTDSKEALDLASFLRQKLTHISEDLSSLEKRVSSNEVSIKAEHEARIKSLEAEQQLNDTRALLEESKDNISPRTLKEVNKDISYATEMLSAGYEKTQNGLYNKAFILFQRSIRYSKEAHLILSARMKLQADTSDVGTSTDGTISATSTEATSTDTLLVSDDDSEEGTTAGSTTPDDESGTSTKEEVEAILNVTI